MSKFLLNLLLQISKALINSKFQFLIQKFFFLISTRPTHWPRHPHRPKPFRSAHPAHASVASSQEIRLPFWFAPSEPAASPTSLCQPDPVYQLRSPPLAAQARSRRHRFLATERLPAPRLGCHRAVTTSPSFPLPSFPS
jgi:hypothetical protein